MHRHREQGLEPQAAKLWHPIAGWACLLSVLCLGCKPTIDFTDRYVERINVVGLLTAGIEKPVLLRIQRSFLPQEGDARQFAPSPDSIKLPLTYTAQLVANGGQDTFSLVRTTAIPKDPGLFGFPVQELFTLGQGDSLKSGAEYSLMVIDSVSGQTKVTSSSRVLNWFEIIPSVILCGDSVDFSEGRSVAVQWRPDPLAYVYIASGKLLYYEYQGNDSILKSIFWNSMLERLIDPSERGGVLAHSFKADEMLTALRSQILDSLPNKRVFAIEVTIKAFDEPYYLYARSANAILQANETPNYYSNIEGGLGVLGASAEFSCTYLLKELTQIYFASAYKKLGFFAY
jgi:hypothetical protein